VQKSTAWKSRPFRPGLGRQYQCRQVATISPCGEPLVEYRNSIFPVHLRDGASETRNSRATTLANGSTLSWRAPIVRLRAGVLRQSAVELLGGWRRGACWRLKGWGFGAPHRLHVGRLTRRRSKSTGGSVSKRLTVDGHLGAVGVERQHPSHFGSLSRRRLVAPHDAVVDLSVDVERPI
jgi:hypothetical protein